MQIEVRRKKILVLSKASPWKSLPSHKMDEGKKTNKQKYKKPTGNISKSKLKGTGLVKRSMMQLFNKAVTLTTMQILEFRIKKVPG